MANRPLSEKKAIDWIVETISRAEPGDAPFALVVGAGFSRGLVPTARELVIDKLPHWMAGLNARKPAELTPAERDAIVGEFWRSFVERNRDSIQLELDERNFPRDHVAAYKAVFDYNYSGALGDPALARRFQREIIQPGKRRLNLAHFLLASIVGTQPGLGAPQDGLFKHRAAFTRLILTTNFDPFLQSALQAVGRLYFMTDRPDLGLGHEYFDDHVDAIHLVYVHGSVHRPHQAANDADIQRLRKENANFLAGVLRRRGVIVLGYSGWDDTIVEALAACDRFEHRLYWCGLEPDPARAGAFGPRVQEILGKSTAFYVQTTGAGQFMAQLFNNLVEGMPRLLGNPVAQARDMLQSIDFSEMGELEIRHAEPTQLPRADAAKQFQKQQMQTLERLARAESLFGAQPPPADAAPQPAAGANAERDLAQPFLSRAAMAEALGNYDEEIRICEEGLALPGLTAKQRASLLFGRGSAKYFIEQWDAAIDDLTTAVNLPGLPADQLAKYLVSRGAAYEQKGDSDKLMADYTRVIDELRGVPIETLGRALINRGVAWGRRRDWDRSVADCTQVIDHVPPAPPEMVARALFNRGVAWDEKHDTDRAIADYTRVVDMSGAPVDLLSSALINRGASWTEKGEVDRALADYARIIDGLPGVDLGQLANALVNRGGAFSKKHEWNQALADYGRVLESMEFAPLAARARAHGDRGWVRYRLREFAGFLTDTELALKLSPDVSTVLFNRGLALLANQRDAEALAAYRVAGERFPAAIEAEGLLDVREASGDWLTPARAEPVLKLLTSLQPAP
jgi:tetratricopeptide (TPR) repeat protein